MKNLSSRRESKFFSRKVMLKKEKRKKYAAVLWIFLLLAVEFGSKCQSQGIAGIFTKTVQAQEMPA